MKMESVIIKNLYPSQFYQFVNDPEEEYSNSEYINSEIKKMLEQFKKDSKMFSLIHMVGNVFIQMSVFTNTEEEQDNMYRVVVAKNYESVYLDRDLNVLHD